MDDVFVVSNLVKWLAHQFYLPFIHSSRLSTLRYQVYIVYQTKIEFWKFCCCFCHSIASHMSEKRERGDSGKTKVMIAKHKISQVERRERVWWWLCANQLRSYKIIKTKMVYYHDWLLTPSLSLSPAILELELNSWLFAPSRLRYTR